MSSEEHRSRFRRLAEQQLAATPVNIQAMSPEAVQALVHELQVHQIELELQNEELRVTQADLDTSRRKYLDLYEFSPVGLLTLDPDEHILEANLTLTAMLEVERSQVINHEFSAFIDPGTQDNYHFFYQKLRQSQQPGQTEVVLLVAGKTPLMVKLDGVMMAEAGQPPTYRIAVSDITARRRAELELRRLYAAESDARNLAERVSARLASLQRITVALSDAVTDEEVATFYLQHSVPMIGAYQGSIMRLAEANQTLETSSYYGTSVQPKTIPLDRLTPQTEAVQYRLPVWILSADDYAARYPDAPQPVSSNDEAAAYVPLISQERVVGVLSYGFARSDVFVEEIQAFIQTLAHLYMQAVERVRLSKAEREKSVLEERQQLARDLHDAVSQTLFVSTMLAENLPKLWERDPERGREQLLHLFQLTLATRAEMHTLLLELRPELILRTPLSQLLRQLIQSIQGKTPLTAELMAEGEEAVVPAPVHLAFYRIAQESINNIVKHSRATRFTMVLANAPHELSLSICDNGEGFNSEVLPASRGVGLGMTGMYERAATIRAILEISSSDAGTEISLRWKPVLL